MRDAEPSAGVIDSQSVKADAVVGSGSLIVHCLATLAPVLTIVKRGDHQKGFVVVRKRWIVERFFAHLMRTGHPARPRPQPA